MLLQRLKEYQERTSDDAADEDMIPAEYMLQAIPWIIHVDASGEHASFVRTSGGQGKRDKGKTFCIPSLRRSGTNVKPQLLADKAEFVLGIATEHGQERVSQRHADFVALVAACAQATQDVGVAAVLAFLQGLPEHPLSFPPDLKPEDLVTFQVENVRPVDSEAVRTFWGVVAPRLGQRGVPTLTPELVLSWLNEISEGVSGECLICGETKPLARVHPVAIKLPRAVSDQQLSIVTANKDAFYSYGLEQSLVAPTCRPCAASYANALNRLARDQHHHLVIGNSIFVFWTREQIAFNPFTLLSDPQATEVRAVLESIWNGKPPADIAPISFYATVISGSGGRAVIRDWIDTTVGEVWTHLQDWFKGQRIVGEPGEEPRPLGLYSLASATVHDFKDLPPTTPRALLRSALTGTPLPMGLLYQAVRRSRAEQRVTRQRAALIKLVLQSHQSTPQEDTMVQLDRESTDAAYRYGRLLAILADIQREAIGKASIIERFYGTASSAPATVFARLLRGAQPHLVKLERDNRGAYIRLQERLDEVMSHISGFRPTLSLQEQAQFALGYYHQRAWDREQARLASERKKAMASAVNATLPAESDATRE